MWFRIFVTSNALCALGIVTIFLGDYVFPALASFTVPVGGSLAGVSVVIMTIAALVLIWKPGPESQVQK